MVQVGEQRVLVSALRYEAQDVISVELAHADGEALAPFSAGAHIDLHLPNGLIRSYSLLNPETDTRRYLIGVFREPTSRGGSQWIHEHLRVGQILTLSGPRNQFPLAQEGRRHVLIAGGIGITPICAMVDRLSRENCDWTLYYCAQTKAKAAFRAQLQTIADASRGQIIFNFDGEPGGRMLDIGSVVANEPPDTHFYCCGPGGMLEAFKLACADREKSYVHFEYFSADTELATEGGFSVVLAKSGKRFEVPAGKTVLDVLIENRVNASYSCQQGICGVCQTGVLAGEPDHRDQILTDEERASNKTMLICCSGARSKELVLDL